VNNNKKQESIEKSIKKEFGSFICYKRIFCFYCKKEENNPCAKAYNRMNYETSKQSNVRDRYSWGD